MIALPRYFGLPSAMLRHLIVLALAGGAVVAQGLVLKVPIDAQVFSWLAVGAGVAIVGALVARGLVGLLFVVVGIVIGLLAIFATQLGSAGQVTADVARHGILYLELVEVAALAYLATLIVLRLGRTSRL